MIYTPKYYLEQPGSERVIELVKTYNFATMIVTRLGAPVISHLPFHYVADDGTNGTLYGHIAVANQQVRDLKGGADVTVIFQGPHAYISPTWYAPLPDNVPTWNYAVVHMHGKSEIISDEGEAYRQMQTLVELHDKAFKLNLSDKDRLALLSAICVFKIAVEKIDAKFKLSQNRSEFDRRSVIEHLKTGSFLERETARLME